MDVQVHDRETQTMLAKVQIFFERAMKSLAGLESLSALRKILSISPRPIFHKALFQYMFSDLFLSRDHVFQEQKNYFLDRAIRKITMRPKTKIYCVISGRLVKKTNQMESPARKCYQCTHRTGIGGEV